MNNRERQLVKSAQKGSVAAFEQLIRPHCKRVYNLMLKICKNEFEASQLAQEVFTKAFQSILEGSFEGAFIVHLYRTADEIARKIPCKSRMIS